MLKSLFLSTALISLSFASENKVEPTAEQKKEHHHGKAAPAADHGKDHHGKGHHGKDHHGKDEHKADDKAKEGK